MDQKMDKKWKMVFFMFEEQPMVFLKFNSSRTPVIMVSADKHYVAEELIHFFPTMEDGAYDGILSELKDLSLPVRAEHGGVTLTGFSAFQLEYGIMSLIVSLKDPSRREFCTKLMSDIRNSKLLYCTMQYGEVIITGCHEGDARFYIFYSIKQMEGLLDERFACEELNERVGLFHENFDFPETSELQPKVTEGIVALFITCVNQFPYSPNFNRVPNFDPSKYAWSSNYQNN